MFLNTWEIDTEAAAHTREELMRDARALLEKIRMEKLFRCSASAGLYPAVSVQDDIEVYRDSSRTEVLARLPMLRQQLKKNTKNPNLSLADYLPQKGSGFQSWMGFFAVTCAGADELGKRYMDQGDDYSALLVKTLADRLAEAFAEYLFLRVRREFWGYAQNEVVSLSDILRGKVRGIRPAPGYPAAPDHALKAEIFRLLDVERKFGMKLTESYMMQPGASVCGMYFAHPKAMYFSIGKIGDDQLADYAKRSGRTPGETAAYLSFAK